MTDKADERALALADFGRRKGVYGLMETSAADLMNPYLAEVVRHTLAPKPPKPALKELLAGMPDKSDTPQPEQKNCRDNNGHCERDDCWLKEKCCVPKPAPQPDGGLSDLATDISRVSAFNHYVRLGNGHQVGTDYVDAVDRIIASTKRSAKEYTDDELVNLIPHDTDGKPTVSVREIIRTITAASRANSWQGIEKCPKDGTEREFYSPFNQRRQFGIWPFVKRQFVTMGGKEHPVTHYRDFDAPPKPVDAGGEG